MEKKTSDNACLISKFPTPCFLIQRQRNKTVRTLSRREKTARSAKWGNNSSNKSSPVLKFSRPYSTADSTGFEGGSVSPSASAFCRALSFLTTRISVKPSPQAKANAPTLTAIPRYMTVSTLLA